MPCASGGGSYSMGPEQWTIKYAAHFAEASGSSLCRLSMPSALWNILKVGRWRSGNAYSIAARNADAVLTNSELSRVEVRGGP
jgi:hypothetical protein